MAQGFIKDNGGAVGQIKRADVVELDRDVADLFGVFCEQIVG